jgi:glucosamine--fructose-6-phosphate aminotransferase (isomerizing)
MDKRIAVIHNGIIENYDTIREELISRGYEFKSQTDTEALVHLIDDIQKTEKVELIEAVRQALQSVIGAYALVVISKDYPNQLIAARKSSPLVVGIGEDNTEFYLASDATPIVEYTNQVVYLNDEEIALVDINEGLRITNIANQEKTPYIQELELHLEALEKGGYEHFMMKEIFEQPRSIHDCFRGRLNAAEGFVQLGGLKDYEKKILNAKRIVFVACGTSWHACQVAEYLIEDLARINVEVEYASEFRYRNPIISEKDVVIAVSQSGETADTLAALDLAKARGAAIFGICNVVGSSISRITDAGSYTHAGPEIGVASTKAFTAQVTVLTLLALRLAYKKETLSNSRFRTLLTELEAIPEKVKRVLEKNESIREIAAHYKDSANALYLGRGSSFPVALEGALKLKEISYIHAEAYPAGELKHGPLALVTDKMPVVTVAPNDVLLEKLKSNLQEVKARGGKLYVFADQDTEIVNSDGINVIRLPEHYGNLSPILHVVPLQLLAYHTACARGTDVDKPRNLAKSVTVE